MAKTNDNMVETNSFGKLKWAFIVLVIAAAIVANIYFDSYSAAIRISILIVIAIILTLIAVTTRQGKTAWHFLKDARMEMRKVVWPTRQETLQTTMLVVAFVALMSVILWGVDSIFTLLVSKIIL